MESLFDLSSTVSLQLREYDGEKQLEFLKKFKNLKFLTMKNNDTDSMNRLIEQLLES